MSLPTVSVVIPTCDRGALLLDTVGQLLALEHPAMEILLVDQTRDPLPEVVAALEALHAAGRVRWLRRPRRSIPGAMNHGARLARGEVVLYLDDDVRIGCELVRAHARAHREQGAAIVAGQVIQPWEQPLPGGEGGYPPGREDEPDAFRFNASVPGPVRRFCGGNVSVARGALLRLGGFDENFVGAAYRFEADLAQRACARGLAIHFEPAASIHHLKAERGGTRGFGSHLRTVAPWHSAGRFYYCLLYPGTPGVVRLTVAESLRCIASREHLRRPWWVALSAVAEAGGLVCAAAARLRGPRLVPGPGEPP